MFACVFACGNNNKGQLGLGDATSRNTFTAVPGLPDNTVVKEVVSSNNHTMILAEDGTMFACGGNAFGQLGLGDTTSRNTFTAVPELPDGKVAKQVVVGDNYTMVLAEDGTVFACGWNYRGLLGLGDTTDRSIFTAVPELPDGKVAKYVIAGYLHTMILAEDGTVFACGWNCEGQLGLGDFEGRHIFTAVPGLKIAKQVVVGICHTMILAEDGTLFACGLNCEGQIGLGNATLRNTFTAVPGLPIVRPVSYTHLTLPTKA